MLPYCFCLVLSPHLYKINKIEKFEKAELYRVHQFMALQVRGLNFTIASNLRKKKKKEAGDKSRKRNFELLLKASFFFCTGCQC